MKLLLNVNNKYRRAVWWHTGKIVLKSDPGSNPSWTKTTAIESRKFLISVKFQKADFNLLHLYMSQNQVDSPMALNGTSDPEKL